MSQILGRPHSRGGLWFQSRAVVPPRPGPSGLHHRCAPRTRPCLLKRLPVCYPRPGPGSGVPVVMALTLALSPTVFGPLSPFKSFVPRFFQARFQVRLETRVGSRRLSFEAYVAGLLYLTLVRNRSRSRRGAESRGRIGFLY